VGSRDPRREGPGRRPDHTMGGAPGLGRQPQGPAPGYRTERSGRDPAEGA